jgi:cytochrome c oxidase subunit 4
MVIRSVPRAPRALTTSLPCTRTSSSLLRTYQSSARCAAPMFQATLQPQTIPQPQQARSAHAISNPTLAGIEKRWEAMPPQEQAELWMQLRDRMKVDWNEMTLQEKKAGMCRIVENDMGTCTSHCCPQRMVPLRNLLLTCFEIQLGGSHLDLMAPGQRIHQGSGPKLCGTPQSVLPFQQHSSSAFTLSPDHHHVQ